MESLELPEIVKFNPTKWLLESPGGKSFPSIPDLAYLSYVVYDHTPDSKKSNKVVALFKKPVNFVVGAGKLIWNFGSYFRISPPAPSHNDQEVVISENEDWVLLGKCRNKRSLNGYKGAAYYNSNSKHIVIAHCGTKFDEVGPLWTDVTGVWWGGYVEQITSAFLFTQDVLTKFGGGALTVTVTGHSLGGWLAQSSTFFMKYPDCASELVKNKDLPKDEYDYKFKICEQLSKDESHHLHCVGFESPGCKPLMEEYLRNPSNPRYPDDRLLPEKKLRNLDITLYFSSVNVINTCNQHVGLLFTIPNLSAQKGQLGWTPWDLHEFYKYTTESHSMLNMSKFLLNIGDKENVRSVLDWPAGIKESNTYHKGLEENNNMAGIRFSTKNVDNNYLSLSSFTELEQEFLVNFHNFYDLLDLNSKLTRLDLFEGYDLNDFGDIVIQVLNEYTEIDEKSMHRIRIDNLNQLDSFVGRVRCLLNYFRGCNNSLEDILKQIISNFPDVFQGVYQGLNKEYVNTLPKLDPSNKVDPMGITKILDSDSYVTQMLVPEAHLTFPCMVQIYRSCNDIELTRGFNLNSNCLFINTTLLQALDRHVRLSVLGAKDSQLKLIIVECLGSKPSELPSTIAEIIRGFSNASKTKLILVTSFELTKFLQVGQGQGAEPSLDEETASGQGNCTSPGQGSSTGPAHGTDHGHESIGSASAQQSNSSSVKGSFLSSIIVKSEVLEIPFESLICEEKNMISERKISLQGRDISLSEICSINNQEGFNRELVDFPFIRMLRSSEDKVTLGREVPELSDFELSCFIPRHFRQIVVDKTSLRELGQILIIECNMTCEKFRNKFVLVDSSQEWEYSTNEGFDISKHKYILVGNNMTLDILPVELLEDTRRWCWLEFDDSHDRFLWISSHWPQPISENDQNKFNHDSDLPCDENTFFDNIKTNSLVIIADEPGMGKSVAMKHFAKKTREYAWVIFLTLENHSEDLDSLVTTRPIHRSKVVELFAKLECPNLPELTGQQIVNNFLNQRDKIVVFFDGYDEISKKRQDIVCEMTQVLRTDTKAKVWIASRVHTKGDLETKFSTFARTLLPFSEEERIDFLEKFWMKHEDAPKLSYDDQGKADIGRIARSLLDKLKKSLDLSEADTFIGIPLQLFMLGQISLPFFIHFSNTRNSVLDFNSSLPEWDEGLFHNIFQLYQSFVGEMYRIALETKCNLVKIRKYPWHDNKLRDSLSEIHGRASFRFLFPDDSKQLFGWESQNVEHSYELEELFRVGIITGLSPSSLRFLHRSMAEYFAAYFLVSRIGRSRDLDKDGKNCVNPSVLTFLRLNYFTPSFDKIRYFFDHFMSKQPGVDKVFGWILDWKNERRNIFKHLESLEETRIPRDLLNRTLFHYAITYGTVAKDKGGILWILIQNYRVFDQADVFGCRFFGYASLVKNYFPVSNDIDGLRWIRRDELRDLIISHFSGFFYPNVGLPESFDFLKLSWILSYDGGMARAIQTGRAFPELDSEEYYRQQQRGDCRDRMEIESFFISPSQVGKFQAIIENVVYPEPDYKVAVMRGLPDRKNFDLFNLFFSTRFYSSDKLILESFELIENEFCNERSVSFVSQMYFNIERNEVKAEMRRRMFQDNLALYKRTAAWLSRDFQYEIWKYLNLEQKKEMLEVMEENGFRFLTDNRMGTRSSIDPTYVNIMQSLLNIGKRDQLVVALGEEKVKEFERKCLPVISKLRLQLGEQYYYDHYETHVVPCEAQSTQAPCPQEMKH